MSAIEELRPVLGFSYSRRSRSETKRFPVAFAPRKFALTTYRSRSERRLSNEHRQAVWQGSKLTNAHDESARIGSGEADPVFEMSMLEDHLALNSKVLSHARFIGSLKHSIGDGDIHISESDGVEVGPLSG